MLEKIKGFWNPYSPEGLRMRANKLPDCPYKVLLTLCAIQLEAKKVREDTVRKAVEYFRTGNKDLLIVGIRMLNLSHDQTTETLCLLKTGKIKNLTVEDNE